MFGSSGLVSSSRDTLVRGSVGDSELLTPISNTRKELKCWHLGLGSVTQTGAWHSLRYPGCAKSCTQGCWVQHGTGGGSIVSCHSSW